VLYLGHSAKSLPSAKKTLDKNEHSAKNEPKKPKKNSKKKLPGEASTGLSLSRHFSCKIRALRSRQDSNP
jgi:hypothetical protein